MAMLITTTFATSKQHVYSKEIPCPSSSSSLKSTSTSSHRQAVTTTTSNSVSTTASSSSTTRLNKDVVLSQSEITSLNLFLRSSKSIAPLQIADIQGVIDSSTGEHTIPAVRKGKIRTSASTSSSSNGIQCCLIDALPFEKCEIVATVVKKNAIYRQGRQFDNSKGKGRAVDGEDVLPGKEEIQLIFYELDDDSGASITCCVYPAKVYANELSNSKRRRAEKPSNRNNIRRQNSEDYSTTDSDSLRDDDETNSSTPRAARRSRRSGEDDDNDSTPRQIAEERPKFDPRLWIYRYKAPAHPAPPPSTTSRTPTFQIPLYKEGTVLRIIGKITINSTRGNERQIEASSVEVVYEPSYVDEHRRRIKEKGNKYAEWHHTVRCRKKRVEFRDREKVREMIGFGTEKNNRDMDESRSLSRQSSVMEDVTMEDVTLPSFAESVNTTSSSSHLISSTSLLNASHLPSNSTTSSSSNTANGNNKRKRAKLPSCSTLYKQKIPITKEIFSLYSHQYFRGLAKSAAAKGSKILSSDLDGGLVLGSSEIGSEARVSLSQMKEDKNLKWLAEIYARNEARRQLSSKEATSSASAVSATNTPKAKPRHMSNAESSVILPSSSPTHSVYHRSTTPGITMQDTTNQSISSSTMKEPKAKLSPLMVDKIRNDLFRSTILKLVKDGIIVVFPADLSAPPPPPFHHTTAKHPAETRTKQECEACKLRMKKELEKIPPHLMTMDGIPLREYTASLSAQETCPCPSSITSSNQAPVEAQQKHEETYALLTTDMLLPILETIVARMDRSAAIEMENVWSTVRRTDDMWRFVSREMVKECLEAI